MQTTLTINNASSYGRKKNIYQSALASLYEKKQIWNLLKDERYSKNATSHLKNRLILSKKIYTIDETKYYKAIGFERDYFIEVDSFNYVTVSKVSIYLYHYTINGMKGEKAQLKVNIDTNKILVSKNGFRSKYTQIKLESLS